MQRYNHLFSAIAVLYLLDPQQITLFPPLSLKLELSDGAGTVHALHQPKGPRDHGAI